MGRQRKCNAPAAPHTDAENWQHESLHWESKLSFQELDEAFRADNGFVPQVGVRKLEGELRYKFAHLPVISELAPYVHADIREDLDGVLVNQSPRVGMEAAGPRDGVLIVEWRPEERARAGFSLGKGIRW